MKYYCFVFLFFRTELFIWFFVEESVAKGFIDCCVCDSSCRLLRRTTGKILKHFKVLVFVFFYRRHKMKYSSYQDSFVIRSWFVYSVWVEESVATGFNKSKKCHASFYITAEYRKSFDLARSLAFRSCIQGEPM